MPHYCFYVYIITNPSRSVLYIGFTNNLETRLKHHYQNNGTNKSFAGKYHCTDLVYYETHKYVLNALAREKEIKKWSRLKKEDLINSTNPKRKPFFHSDQREESSAN